MIIYRRKEIKQEQFGDGTLKALVPENLSNGDMLSIVGSFFGADSETITWCYDNDSEIFTLNCLVDAIRDARGNNVSIELRMPYIPHARQDRKVSGRFFTLKTFAKMINQMNFSKVVVLDPHSDVSTALIDRVVAMDVNVLVDSILLPYDTIMFPDLGSSKKYTYLNVVKNHKVVVGNKVRDWSTGEIKHLEILGNATDIKDKDVLIVDDVCSFGSTYFFAGQKLKEIGARNIYLYVSHCEDSIYKGKLMEQGSPIDTIITTDSLLKEEKDKVKIIKYFRDFDS